eukprot:4691246-Amphidinium_carterae.1
MDAEFKQTKKVHCRSVLHLLRLTEDEVDNIADKFSERNAPHSTTPPNGENVNTIAKFAACSLTLMPGNAPG